MEGLMVGRGSRISEEQLRRIADIIPAIVALYSVKTAQYLYVNQAIETVLGYTPDEFLGGGLGCAVAMVHPEDVQGLLAKNQAALDAYREQPANGKEPVVAFEYRMRHKDGHYLWVQTDGTVFGRAIDGSVELILNVSINITEQKQTEEQLKHSMRALEQMLKL